MSSKEWFADWFDTDYYHLLYKQRDNSEAAIFIKNLVHHLTLEKDSPVLDLACGKGRHSITLNQLGFDVLGVDLSANSITEAKKMENDTLHFQVQDMRYPIPNKQFGAVFNLFTSFGYFDSIDENTRVIKAIHQMLIPEGTLVIDFMNAKRIIAQLVAHEQKDTENITFNISRRYDGTHIFKDIQFTDQGKDFHFTERVQALFQNDFIQLLSTNGFRIITTFGDFSLNTFDEIQSDRLIIVAKKN